jgi:hypothetical protein
VVVVAESGGVLSLDNPVGDSAESGVVEAWLSLAICTKSHLELLGAGQCRNFKRSRPALKAQCSSLK